MALTNYYSQGPLSHFESGVADGPNTAYIGTTDSLTYPGRAVISSTGVDACTLGTPVSGSTNQANSSGLLGQDGLRLEILSTTAHAHTVTTAAGKILDGTGTPKHIATFAAQAGANIVLRAQGGFWYLLSSVAVTLT